MRGAVGIDPDITQQMRIQPGQRRTAAFAVRPIPDDLQKGAQAGAGRAAMRKGQAGHGGPFVLLQSPKGG